MQKISGGENMNAKNIILLTVLLTFLNGTAAQAFPFFGRCNYYPANYHANYCRNAGFGFGNYNGWGNNGWYRHHCCHRHGRHRGWGW